LATPLKAWAQRFAFFALILAAFGLMLLGKADSLLLDRARSAVVDAVTPILDAASRPVATINQLVAEAEGLAALRAENLELKGRNERLLHWQGVALRLEAENKALRELLQLAPEPYQTTITGRVVGDQGGAFVRAVVINAGAREGVKRGQAALTGSGLAGRVTQVGQRSARVLLVTDINSRIPVFVGAGRERAVMAGDNSPQPSLLYLGPRVTVEPGDRVVTSGDGGVIPPGLPVGVVAAVTDGIVKVQPYVDINRSEFLRIIDYEMPGLLLPAGSSQ